MPEIFPSNLIEFVIPFFDFAAILLWGRLFEKRKNPDARRSPS
jgi:hypothetical protein